MNDENDQSQKSLGEDLLQMCFDSAEGETNLNLNPPETDLWGLVNPNALLSTAIGGSSGGGNDYELNSILSM